MRRREPCGKGGLREPCGGRECRAELEAVQRTIHCGTAPSTGRHAVAVLLHGDLVEFGPAGGTFFRPNRLYTAHLVASRRGDPRFRLDAEPART
ncbi:hypothetical protein ACFY94_09900 [Streptomyces griseorubiginosus]|uniref:hypothetical protein n=1 Tax=Streptomyces griseorubiginosus TaxID=67304 RepID=UPI0036EC46BA